MSLDLHSAPGTLPVRRELVLAPERERRAREEAEARAARRERELAEARAEIARLRSPRNASGP